MSDTWIPVEALPSSARLGGAEIYCDGINANRCNDGHAANARLWGVRPPTAAQLAAITHAEAEGGNITAGDHLVAVTFAVVSNGVVLSESAPVQLDKITVGAASQKITLSNLPISDNAAVNARIIYMSAAGGTTLYRVTEAATLADNTTTTYDITAADTSLTAIELSNANYVLDAKPFVCVHNDHLWLWGDRAYTTGTVSVTNGSTTATFTGAALTRAMENKELVVGTDVASYSIVSVNETAQTAVLSSAYAGSSGSGKSYKITGNASTLLRSNPLPLNIEGYDPSGADTSIDVALDDGDEGTGIGLCRGNLVVGKKRHLYLVTGKPGTYAVDRISDRIGVASHHTMVETDAGQAIWYAGEAGVYMMDTNEPVCISKAIEPWLREDVNHDRDAWAHAVWYSARQWYMLWVTDAGESICNRVYVCDLSDRQLGPRWWTFTLAASISRIEKLDDDQWWLLLGNYQGQLWAFDVGELDGVANMTAMGVISAVGADSITCDNGQFIDISTGGQCKGALVTILSGAAIGQQRYVASSTAQTLTIHGSFFDPAPAVGDVIMVGGYASYWTCPLLSVGRPTIKRWQQAIIDTDALGSDVRLEQIVQCNGRELAAGHEMIVASERNRTVAALRGRGERWQGVFVTDGPATPFLLSNLVVTAEQQGGVR